MSSSAIETQGMAIKVSSGSPSVFTLISDVTDFSGPSGSANVIDVSDLQSTAREKKQGLSDSGQFAFNMNYIPNDTQHALLQSAWASRTRLEFQMEFTDSPTTTWTFYGYVNGFNISGAVDDVVKAAVTVEIDGDITIV